MEDALKTVEDEAAEAMAAEDLSYLKSLVDAPRTPMLELKKPVTVTFGRRDELDQEAIPTTVRIQTINDVIRSITYLPGTICPVVGKKRDKKYGMMYLVLMPGCAPGKTVWLFASNIENFGYLEFGREED